MSVFRRLLGQSEKGNGKSRTELVDEISEYQPYNPFTELLFLEQHKDIIRLLIRIDPKRCVSAADDNLAVAWDIQFGYKLVTFSGHSRPITSMITLPTRGTSTLQLVTASSDKQIRIWNLETGDCINVLTQHKSTVKCLLLYGDDGRFCSAGELICLWSSKGQLLVSYSPEISDNDISLMILLRNDRLVAAMDKNLGVFTIQQRDDKETAEISLVKKLSPHREPVKCLINVGGAVFASASLDGTVKLWRTDSLQVSRYFNSDTEEYEGPQKTFPYSVGSMICIENRYVVVSVGSGFTIYDSETGDTVLQKENAHHSKINDLTFTCEGMYLATAAVDGSIRLWSFVEIIKDNLQGSSLYSDSKQKNSSMVKAWYTASSHNCKLTLVGECLAHSGSVQALIDCDDESIVSCGVDGLVIVWKNENMQMVKRNHVLHAMRMVDGIV